jgi:hypothetical protein
VSGEAVTQGVGIVAPARHGHSKGSFINHLFREPPSLNIITHAFMVANLKGFS